MYKRRQCCEKNHNTAVHTGGSWEIPTPNTNNLLFLCYCSKKALSLGQIILYVPLKLSMEQDRKKRTQPTMASSVSLVISEMWDVPAWTSLQQDILLLLLPNYIWFPCLQFLSPLTISLIPFSVSGHLPWDCHSLNCLCILSHLIFIISLWGQSIIIPTLQVRKWRFREMEQLIPN